MKEGLNEQGESEGRETDYQSMTIVEEGQKRAVICSLTVEEGQRGQSEIDELCVMSGELKCANGHGVMMKVLKS